LERFGVEGVNPCQNSGHFCWGGGAEFAVKGRVRREGNAGREEVRDEFLLRKRRRRVVLFAAFCLRVHLCAGDCEFFFRNNSCEGWWILAQKAIKKKPRIGSCSTLRKPYPQRGLRASDCKPVFCFVRDIFLLKHIVAHTVQNAIKVQFELPAVKHNCVCDLVQRKFVRDCTQSFCRLGHSVNNARCFVLADGYASCVFHVY